MLANQIPGCLVRLGSGTASAVHSGCSSLRYVPAQRDKDASTKRIQAELHAHAHAHAHVHVYHPALESARCNSAVEVGLSSPIFCVTGRYASSAAQWRGTLSPAPPSLCFNVSTKPKTGATSCTRRRYLRGPRPVHRIKTPHL